MRTAEEIYKRAFSNTWVDDKLTSKDKNVIKQAVIRAINEARKESIEETSKKFFYKGFEKCKNDDANCFTAWREEAPNLILSIIKELK